MPTFKSIRILVLLSALLLVLFISTHQRASSRSWTAPLETVIYPINGDGYLSTSQYIDSLQTRDFKPIDLWMFREARRYDLALDKPVNVVLGPRVDKHPPAFPTNPDVLSTLIWGLKFRWFAFRNTPDSDQANFSRVRIFVMYYEGEDDTPLAHSIGLEKGLLGLVHAFALPEQTQQNNIIIAHELLHTVGAVDKYDSRGLPVYPYGYADPGRVPLFPQHNAEIMAGRIPFSYSQAAMAESLSSVRINAHTAAEINWLSATQ